MKMLHLPQVTLVAVACTKVEETIEALRISMRGIAYAEALLITHEKIDLSYEGIKVIHIKKLNYKEYNHFIIFRLKDYINTKFCLLVQNDGYVLHPDQWSIEFLKYDYIGAPWPPNVHFTSSKKNIRVGNGGFTLRSRKILEAPTKLKLTFTDKNTGYFHEDGFLCVHFRDTLEKTGIKFAPVQLASQFSKEVLCYDSVQRPFGFHNKAHTHHLLWLKQAFRKIKSAL
jgi:hypothetical protein